MTKPTVMRLLDELVADRQMRQRFVTDSRSVAEDYGLSAGEIAYLVERVDVPPDDSNTPSERIGMQKYNRSAPQNVQARTAPPSREQVVVLGNPDYYVRLVTVVTNTVTTNTVTFTTTTETPTPSDTEAKLTEAELREAIALASTAAKSTRGDERYEAVKQLADAVAQA